MSSYDLSLEPPDVLELTDDPGTNCLGTYPEESVPPAMAGTYECESRLTCHLCDGVVCTEHDDVANCGDGPAHQACHKDGCYSASCARDARDDYLIAQDDADHGR